MLKYLVGFKQTYQYFTPSWGPSGPCYLPHSLSSSWTALQIDVAFKQRHICWYIFRKRTFFSKAEHIGYPKKSCMEENIFVHFFLHYSSFLFVWAPGCFLWNKGDKTRSTIKKEQDYASLFSKMMSRQFFF